MIMFLPAPLIIAVVTIALSFIGYIDYKKKEINLWVLLVMTIACTVYTFITKRPFPLLSVGLGAAIGIIPFLFMTLTAKGGGGDVLLMGGLGLCLGSYGIIMNIAISGVLYIGYGVIIWMKQISREESDSAKEVNVWKQQYPYAPFVAIAWYIYCIIGIIQNGFNSLQIP